MKDVTDRFTGHAGAYNAGRPVYPREAIDLVFEGLGEPARLRVADLGAGTGISSRMLAERGATVFAVEPNAAMRSKAGTIRDVTWIAESAEGTGLPAASIDIVTAFQAFHWFDRPATFAEIQRIARPGARAVAVYYERDESDPFTATYGDLVRRFATDDTEGRRADALAAFEQWDGWAAVRRSDVPAQHVLDVPGWGDRVASTSYLPTTGERGDALRAEASALFEANAADGRVTLALVTTIVVAELR
jgi:SAM-dependent methyltransferase